MGLTREQVTQILERRYDYVSARVVFNHAVERTGLGADGPFDGEALEALANAVLAIGDRVDGIASALRAVAAPHTLTAPAKTAAREPQADIAQLDGGAAQSADDGRPPENETEATEDGAEVADERAEPTEKKKLKSRGKKKAG